MNTTLPSICWELLALVESLNASLIDDLLLTADRKWSKRGWVQNQCRKTDSSTPWDHLFTFHNYCNWSLHSQHIHHNQSSKSWLFRISTGQTDSPVHTIFTYSLRCNIRLRRRYYHYYNWTHNNSPNIFQTYWSTPDVIWSAKSHILLYVKFAWLPKAGRIKSRGVGGLHREVEAQRAPRLQADISNI